MKAKLELAEHLQRIIGVNKNSIIGQYAAIVLLGHYKKNGFGVYDILIICSAYSIYLPTNQPLGAF